MMRIWAQAKKLAEQTPEERNRYVDFLRSVSIMVVIAGHWMIATAYVSASGLENGHLLKSHPQTQWLTWIFQVMPIFFIVGGYANGVSLESARRKSVSYAAWLAARLNRLVAPLLLLMTVWAGIALLMTLFDVSPDVIQYSSQAALIPTWFLAIYITVAMLAPYTYQFWRKYGFASFWCFVAIALFVDVLFFLADIRWPSWSNYFWVWLAVHQLGFAWRDKRMGTPRMLLAYSTAGFCLLALLILKGPYPIAMVGSPDEGLSNTLPPKITLIALGVFQFGLLLSIEAPMRRVLANLRIWTLTVLINSMIMTIYLWHITLMILLVSLLYFAGGFGLELEPGTKIWWLTRPVWIAVLVILLLPVALMLSPLERRSRERDAPVPSSSRQVVGALMICLGVALLAMYGFGGGPIARLDAISFLMIILGSGISGLLSGFRKVPQSN